MVAIKLDGGAAGAKRAYTAGATITATLDSTDGVRSTTWRVAGTDDTKSPGDYTLTPSGSVSQTCTLTAAGEGTALILEAKINGGIDSATGRADAAKTVATVKAYVATPSGLEVLATSEETEGDATHGWTGVVNGAIRTAVTTSGTSSKQACRAATTGNITLSGAQTIDGVSVVAADRVLVKNQSTASQNGIYLAAAGAWTRAIDFDSGAEAAGAIVYVREGTANGKTIWALTTTGSITIGTTGLTFEQIPAVSDKTRLDAATSSATGTTLVLRDGSGGATFGGTLSAAAISTSGGVTVGGDLTVNGSTTTVNSTVVDIVDRVVHVNHSTGANDAPPSLMTGLSVHRGAVSGVKRDNASLLWNESNVRWETRHNSAGGDTSFASFLTHAALSFISTDSTVSSTYAKEGVTYGSNAGAVTLKQADVTSASATGSTLLLQSQNATGTTSTGGILDLRSGTGTSAAGAISIRTGSTERIGVTGAGALTVASDGTSSITNTSGNLTIATATSGDLILDGRTNLVLQSAGVTRATVAGGSITHTVNITGSADNARSLGSSTLRYSAVHSTSLVARDDTTDTSKASIGASSIQFAGPSGQVRIDFVAQPTVQTSGRVFTIQGQTGGAASAGAGGSGSITSLIAGTGGDGTGAIAAGAGGTLNINAGTGGAANGGPGGAGGSVAITGGNATGSGNNNGGDVSIDPGAKTASGNDGNILIGTSQAPKTITLGVTSNYARLLLDANGGALQWQTTDRVKVNSTGLGFFNVTPVARPDVTGSRGGNAALADLLTDLASLGLITDSTTA